MTFSFANAQDNPLLSQAVMKLYQHLGGSHIHVYHGFGINKKDRCRGLGRIDQLLNPVCEMGGIKKRKGAQQNR